jgi:hypothetical protein
LGRGEAAPNDMQPQPSRTAQRCCYSFISSATSIAASLRDATDINNFLDGCRVAATRRYPPTRLSRDQRLTTQTVSFIMAATLTNIVLHVTYSTKHRESTIPVEMLPCLFAHIGNVVRESDAVLTRRLVAERILARIRIDLKAATSWK